MVGQIKEKTALSKLRPLLDAARADPDRLPALATGQFLLVREAEALAIEVDLNALPARQLPEERILALAAAGISPERS